MLKRIFEFVNGTIPIGTYFGIPFKIHWTIIPFFIFIPFLGAHYNMSITESLLLLALVIMILVSVLLHELGHAVAARSEQIKTHDILVSLIGGAARLEQIPEDPKKEIKIAFAGPLVNLLLFTLMAIPLLVFFLFGQFRLDLSYTDLTKPGVFLSLVAISNLLLFLFNLIPAFPMDGGRIFRALLARRMSREKATKIASIIGKIIASLMIIGGLVFIKPVYILIGIFVFLMAEIENSQEKNNIRYRSIKAGEICDKIFPVVKLSTSMKELIDVHFDDDTDLFIVMGSADKKVKGIIDRHRLEDCMRERHPEYAVSYYLNHRYAIVNIENNLLHVYEELIVKEMPIALVMDYGELVGILDKETVLSYMQLKS